MRRRKFLAGLLSACLCGPLMTLSVAAEQTDETSQTSMIAQTVSEIESSIVDDSTIEPGSEDAAAHKEELVKNTLIQKQTTQLTDMMTPSASYTLEYKEGEIQNSGLESLIKEEALKQIGVQETVEEEPVEEEEEEPQLQLAMLSDLKKEIAAAKQEIKEAQKTEASIEYLGITSYTAFDTLQKQDVTKSAAHYLYGDYLLTVTGYDESAMDSVQTVHIDSKQLPPTSCMALEALSSSNLENKDSAMQQALTTIADLPTYGSSTVTIKNKDVTPPKVEVKEDVKVEVGQTISEEEIVETATDSQGEEVPVEITGEVDTETPGTYTVQVQAEDAAGNQTTEEVQIEVLDDFYQRIANSALSQIGVNQDCTMLVTNALASVGIYHHGWPISYMNLGTVTANPVPGDIIVYSGHVAIYVGNGQAVHGGWNGYTTVLYSVNCSAPFIAYIHPYHT